jgi:hypothetical protein
MAADKNTNALNIKLASLMSGRGQQYLRHWANYGELAAA